jgi:glutaredoxin
MTITTDLEIFCKHDCVKCSKLADFLHSAGITFVQRDIDAEPDVETEALMLGIFAAPALKKGDNVMRVKDLFRGNQMQKDAIMNFVQN